MIEIIPNWHPIFVHFTVALFSTSVGFYVLAYLTTHVKCLQCPLAFEFEIVARWCLWMTALITLGTLGAGLYAYNTVHHDEISHVAMTHHRNLAFITASSIWLMTAWSIWRYGKQKGLTWSFILLLIIVQGLLLSTGWRGGELVYRYGLGVISLPVAKDMGHHQMMQ